MRDDRHRWTAYDGAWSPLEAGGITIAPVDLDRQTLISGAAVLSHYPEATGWPQVAKGESYALPLRRDRVLVVNGPQTQDGWDEDRELAVSDATDAYTVFDLSGPHALDLLKRGTEIGLHQPSRSVARALFGLGVLLYRHGAEDRFRLHVPPAQSQSLWQNLTAHAAGWQTP